MLVWRKGNINKNCLCATVLCTIIMVHNGMSSSYRLRCHIDFQDGSRCGAVLLPVLDWVSDFFQKVIVYLHTKFYHDKSICG